MKKADLLFYSLVLIMLNLVPVLENTSPETINLFAMAAILVLGIPHGAIDNTIFLKNSSVPKLLFFVLYISAILVNASLWFIFPQLAYVTFILLSAYHFGQSQWSDLDLPKSKYLLFLSWGLSVILAYVFFNSNELSASIAMYSDLEVFGIFFKATIIGWAFLLSVACMVGVIAYQLIRGNISWERMMQEAVIFGLVLATAYFFSFLIGFALFFIPVHAFKVMKSEYKSYFTKPAKGNLLRFIYALLPLSLLSFAGIGLLSLLVLNGFLNISFPLLFLVVISSITLPHAFVMERFYGSLRAVK